MLGLLLDPGTDVTVIGSGRPGGGPRVVGPVDARDSPTASHRRADDAPRRVGRLARQFVFHAHQSVAHFTGGEAQLHVAGYAGFSGIVSGNVREETMDMIEAKGPFEIAGDERHMALLDRLLSRFVDQGRMKLETGHYEPCYRVLG